MKQVQKTAEIIGLLQASFGPDVNIEDYAVYEAVALNNLPIRQKHPLYEGAVAQDSLLRELVTSINGESVALQIAHNTDTLPVGRVFHAKLMGQEVRALFALSKTTEKDYVAKLDQGIVDQVSVNVLPKQILCSECGFDYIGPDASIMNVFEGQCGNEHALREDGVHAKLHGLGNLTEISLVFKGGAQKARILNRNDQVFGQEAFQRLAASGHSPELLVASVTPSLQEDDNNMELTALVDQLTTVKADNTALTASVTALTARADTADAAVATLTAERDALATQVATLEAAAAETPAEAPPAVLAALSDIYKHTQIALGVQAPVVPEKIDDILAGIEAGKAKLTAALVAGGKTIAAADGSGGDDLELTYAPRAYRRNPN